MLEMDTVDNHCYMPFTSSKLPSHSHKQIKHTSNTLPVQNSNLPLYLVVLPFLCYTIIQQQHTSRSHVNIWNAQTACTLAWWARHISRSFISSTATFRHSPCENCSAVSIARPGDSRSRTASSLIDLDGLRTNLAASETFFVSESTSSTPACWAISQIQHRDQSL